MNAQYDLIIVGSGPGGVAAGLAGTRLGLSVLIVAPGNSNSIIYESIHSGIETLTDYIGCTNILYKSVVGEFDGVKTGESFFDWRGELYSFRGLHIDRTYFNCLMQAKICNYKGIDCLIGEKVDHLLIKNKRIIGVITNAGKKIISKYTIDASGFRKFSGRYLNLKEQFFSPPLVAWTGACEVFNNDNSSLNTAISYFETDVNGWSWQGYITSNKCYWTRLSLKGKQIFAPPPNLTKYLLLGDIKKTNRRWSIFRPLYSLGIILCGEAGATLDPASGQGILNALYSGIKAAETAFGCIKAHQKEIEILRRYDIWFYELITNKISILSSEYKRLGILL